MKQYSAKNIFNIALAGHSGSGKTSLAEAMLYLGGGSDGSPGGRLFSHSPYRRFAGYGSAAETDDRAAKGRGTGRGRGPGHFPGRQHLRPLRRRGQGEGGSRHPGGGRACRGEETALRRGLRQSCAKIKNRRINNDASKKWSLSCLTLNSLSVI